MTPGYRRTFLTLGVALAVLPVSPIIVGIVFGVIAIVRWAL